MKKYFVFFLIVSSMAGIGCSGVSASNSGEKTRMAVDKLTKSQTTKDKAEAEQLAGEAFEMFDAIKNGDQNGANNFLLIGQALFNYSYIDQAEAILKLGIETLPHAGLKDNDFTKTKDGLHYTLYLLYRAKSDIEKSIEAIEPVKDRYPQIMVQSNMERGYKLFEEGKHREALSRLETVVKQAHEMRSKYPMFNLQEQMENATYYASECYKKLGSSQDLTLEIFRLGIEAYPENYNMLVRFVNAAKKAKKLDALLEKYKSEADKNALMYLLLAKVYDYTEQKKLAKEYQEKYQKLTNAKEG